MIKGVAFDMSIPTGDSVKRIHVMATPSFYAGVVIHKSFCKINIRYFATKEMFFSVYMIDMSKETFQKGEVMEDNNIVELYLNRDEKAIEETENKYNGYLMKIAYNVLGDFEDSKEVVNDTYLKTWNSIPPHRPEKLTLFLGKIVRQSAIDRYRMNHSKKRYDSEYAVSLSEFDTDIAGPENVEDEVGAKLLGEQISEYLKTKSSEYRRMFVGRYYYLDSVKDIAGYVGATQSKVKSALFHMREELKEYISR